MKPGIARKWVAALRSGKYEQTTGTLRRGDAFCCLGVLCNLHAQAHPGIAARQPTPDQYMGSEGTLPMSVRAWASINANPMVENYTLSEWNDVKGADFDRIATLIERNAAAL